jgi:hypothetical protein
VWIADRVAGSIAILAHPDLRIADGANHAGFKVGQPANIVDHLKGPGIVEQRIDREIAPQRIFLRSAESIVLAD